MWKEDGEVAGQHGPGSSTIGGRPWMAADGSHELWHFHHILSIGVPQVSKVETVINSKDN